MSFRKFLAAQKLEELLRSEGVSSRKGIAEDDLGRVIDAINEAELRGQHLDRHGLTEIIQKSIDGLTVTTEGISNDDLDTLLALARKANDETK